MPPAVVGGREALVRVAPNAHRFRESADANAANLCAIGHIASPMSQTLTTLTCVCALGKR